MKIPKAGIRPVALYGAAVLLSVIFIAYAWAGNVTAATGGSAISADTAATGGTGTWTSLSGPNYAETKNGDLINGTVILTVPAGFEFNTAVPISVVLLSGDSNSDKNMNGTALGQNVASTTNSTLAVTATTITFSISKQSKGNTLDQIQWQGIQVRPTSGTPLANGNITASGTSKISTAASSTNFGTLTEIPGAMTQMLTVLPGQIFTAGTGVTGTASTQTAGAAFNLTQLVATDKFNNPVTTYNGTKTISYSDPSSGSVG